MKIKEIRLDLLYKQDNIVISLEKGQHQRALQLIQEIEFNPDKDYEILIKKKTKKRSLDANAYFWVLVGKLSEKLHRKRTEIYKELIREVGVAEIVPIKKEAVDRWIKNWESKGLGWVCEDMGECKNFKEFNYIKNYYGSSTYNTKEMSLLIDTVIDECKEQGIETLPPEELEKLKQNWS